MNKKEKEEKIHDLIKLNNYYIERIPELQNELKKTLSVNIHSLSESEKLSRNGQIDALIAIINDYKKQLNLILSELGQLKAKDFTIKEKG